ncbi:MAG: DUF4830 domain-containing protein [Clostridia bacterium]|nr:DUF4830 domain-containing protein [Clostridia bacterium]
MFVYSLKANTIKFFGVLCVAMVALITLIAFLPSYDPDMAVSAQDKGNEGAETVSISYGKVKTNEDRIKFLQQFGWEVAAEPIENEEVVIPAEFDKVFAGYNEIQKSQGLDLGKYKKKKLTRYTYEVTNYEGYDGKVLANILVYRGKVVGGDICSADPSGFLKGFEK